MVEKSTPVTSNKKRQPNKLPLLNDKNSTKKSKPATKKQTKKTSKKATAGKKTTKKTVVQKPMSRKTSTKKSTTKKSPTKKTTAKEKTQSKSINKTKRQVVKKPTTTKNLPAKKRTLHVWFGPKYTLEIKISPTKNKSSKKNFLTPRRKSALFVVVGLLAMSYFASNLFVAPEPPIVYSAPAPMFEPVQFELADPLALPPSKPVSLRIDSVNITTDILTVGRNDDGTLTVPKRFDIVGWYQFSPTPGELGPSIITGHVDSYKGPAVFWKLGQVQAGNTIDITREDGRVVTYVVEQVKQFDQNNFPTEEVYGNIDHIGLRLITCGGVFNRTTQSYSHNTVVYARLQI